MGYDYTVSDTVAVEILLRLRFSTRKHSPWPLVPFFQNFYEEQWSQILPQYLSGLSRALFPTTFSEIAVYLDASRLDITTNIHLPFKG